jgi:hypothetical protein
MKNVLPEQKKMNLRNNQWYVSELFWLTANIFGSLSTTNIIPFKVSDVTHK